MKTNVQATKQISGSTQTQAAGLQSIAATTTRCQAIKEHLCCELNGEAVILSLKNGKYYGLNPVASRIWELIQEPRTPAEIQNAILLEYEVESEICRREVSAFLTQMAAEGLVLVIDEKARELF